MSVSTPHYLLFCEASGSADCGRWRFMLRAVDGSDELEASDDEPEIRGQRLDLLTVVRALESLDQPSYVTLVGCSPYVRQGIQYGVPEWRNNGWRWEFFGQMVPVKDCDLWQRLDRVMRFHEVECRHRRFDSPHGVPAPVIRGPWGKPIRRQSGREPVRPAAGPRLEYRTSAVVAQPQRTVTAMVRLWRRRISGAWRALASWSSGRISGHRAGSLFEVR